jgi:Outer membrane protein beta-barrel domain
MRYRLAPLLAILLYLFSTSPAKAQYGRTSFIEKFELTPFGGFQTSGSYPVTNSFTVDRLRADSGGIFGAFVDYNLTDNVQAEFMWARNDTSFSEHDATTNTYSKAFNSAIDQYEVGLLYMFRNSDTKLRPFADFGIGAAHESNDGGNPNRTLLLFGLGGGAKYALTRHIALRGDVRWVPSRANRTPGVTCDFFGNCFTQNVTNYLQWVNFTGGVVFHF